jgi:hypothetical protein
MTTLPPPLSGRLQPLSIAVKKVKKKSTKEERKRVK